MSEWDKKHQERNESVYKIAGAVEAWVHVFSNTPSLAANPTVKRFIGDMEEYRAEYERLNTELKALEVGI